MKRLLCFLFILLLASPADAAGPIRRFIRNRFGPACNCQPVVQMPQTQAIQMPTQSVQMPEPRPPILQCVGGNCGNMLQLNIPLPKRTP